MAAQTLSGRVVFVTACSSDLGRAVVFDLAAQGASLILTDPNREEGNAVCHEVREQHGRTNIIFTSLQLGDLEALKRFITNACGQKGLKRLDAVVHCASYSPKSRPDLHLLPTEAFTEIIDRNIVATNNVLSAALHQILLQKETAITGHDAAPAGGYSIVVIGHVAPSHKEDRSPVYDASTAFVTSLAKSVAREYGHHDIRCNVVNVGHIERTLTERFFEAQDTSDVALARPGKISEMTSAISFLLGPASSYVTGQVISVDGGATI